MSGFGALLRRLFGGAKEPGPDDLVLLAEAEGEAVAEMWRGMLEQRGVHCLVKNVSSLAHLRIGAPYEVYVLGRDVEYAREVLGL
jgi:hypothetical protein